MIEKTIYVSSLQFGFLCSDEIPNVLKHIINNNLEESKLSFIV